MLSFLADENFSHRILRAIRLRIEGLDLVIVQRVGKGGARDPELLAWAAEQNRILLTHDRQTIPKHAYDRIRAHLKMPGVIVVSDTLPVGEAIEVVSMYIECGTVEDFNQQVFFLP